MNIHIHIGAHKTATTHLQQGLRAVQGDLLAAGWNVLGPQDLRSTGLAIQRVLSRLTDQEASISEIRATLARPAKGLLLTDENLIGGTRRQYLLKDGQIYPDAVQRMQALHDLLPDGQVTLFLGVRDPAEFVTSAFSLQVQMGTELVFDDYLAAVDPLAIRWSELAVRLIGLPWVSRLICWRYEDYPANRINILSHLLAPALAPLVPDLPARNEGLSQAALDHLLTVAATDFDSDLRMLARQAMRQFPKSAGHPRLRLLPDAVHAATVKAYADDLAQLAALPRVTLLRG